MSRKVKTFDDILRHIRSSSKNTTELGTRFEKITKEFLETDAQYEGRFTRVDLWKNWKYNDGPDTGIDLVAEDVDGNWCAIQCKCYDDDGNLDLKTLGTFFAKASSLEKKHKKKVKTLLVYTGDRTTANADRLIDDHNCQVIDQEKFRNSNIVWTDFPKLRTKKPKELRPHQKAALANVVKGFKKADRGKMIMACGTGKTLTALRIAETMAGVGKSVLYLVPSISLIHQTMKEWSENASLKHHYAVVCSDKTAGEDEDGSVSELAYPPTTNPKELAERFTKNPKNTMSVIFSTYHSIDVASKAMGNRPFDLVLCDEAHRTTGVEKDMTHFTKVHDNSVVKTLKRLYMTATPRVYGEAIKNKQNVHSMDDPATYGEELYDYSFSRAVEDEQLADFKVRIPVISEEDLERYTNESIDGISDDGTIDERVLLAAVWHGLNYNNDEKTPLLQRVIAFCNKIAASKQFSGMYLGNDLTQDEERAAKKARKNEDEGRITQNRSFANTVEKYELTSKWRTGNAVSVRHMDGAMRASIRNNKMRWLRASNENPSECRILSNARCLSEGVDVPGLDGVIFLQPRKSKTDVVQSVGRVMRKADGKDYGYVILPVVVPTGMSIEESLHDVKAWKTVWQVLSALRSHNPNFANEINRVHLDRGPGGYPPPLENVEIVWMGSLSRLPEPEIFGKLVTKMVDKVGDRAYFDERSKELGRKARQIWGILAQAHKNKNKTVVETVAQLCSDLKSIVNDSVDEKETIRVLAQHYALSQVFAALFRKEFRVANPMARALDRAIGKIGLQSELKQFDKYFENVTKEASKFENVGGKQKYIKKIYSNFLLGYDQKEQQARGVVYTPDEIIDFIIHSTEHVLRTEFQTGFNRNDVKIFDPFTGTGSFIARLLESGLIKSNKLELKYCRDIWANEISLLAYYVAAVNIESVFSKVSACPRPLPFKHINYTDTLNHNPRYRVDKRHRLEKSVLMGKEIKKVHETIQKSKWQHIHVIIGNPPYSMGQKNATDNNQNLKYPDLDERISSTYMTQSSSTQKRALYDSYIRSLRWASDRIGDAGVVAFITNAGFLRSDAGAGIRAALAREFNKIWCFDLRGQKGVEGDGRNIFEYKGTSSGGTTVSTVILILMKKPTTKHEIKYARLDKEHYSGDDKRKRVQQLKSIEWIKNWQTIVPNEHHDWIDKRDGMEKFYAYTELGNEDAKAKRPNAPITIFTAYSNGVGTSRDHWAYNSSKTVLTMNMERHINHCVKQDPDNPDQNPKKCKWNDELADRLKRAKSNVFFDRRKIRLALYRPFFKQYLYFDTLFNSRPGIVPAAFPNPDSKNTVIIVPYKIKDKYSVFVTDITPDLEVIHHGQCFPLYVYVNGKRSDNISSGTLSRFHKFYNNSKITKKHIFEYVYGMLHHPTYREEFHNILIRDLPRIPLAHDFWAIRNVGKALMNLHLNFETCERYDLGKPKIKVVSKFTKLSFGKKEAPRDDGRKNVPDYTVLRIDGVVLFDNVPETTYLVNGKAPVQWVVQRYGISVDDKSGITNDSTVGIDIISIIERAVYLGYESERLIKTLPTEFQSEDTPKIPKFNLDAFTNEV